MPRRFRLAAVLRARQVQEDVAKSAVVRARLEATAAVQRHAERERSLLERPPPDGGPASRWVAAAAARAALADELSTADRLAVRAAAEVGERATELTGAAIRRRSVETLADRQWAAEQQEELATEQRALDEVAGNRHLTGRTEL
ncbi:MAG TPA: flagellar FliJ family protein [Mycobacteriales bacterium]|nr:flagellar FliJ family protein [Mycobacteriales bacterium]